MFNILIAEDDLDLGRLFKKVLENSGYRVTLAPDGRQALEAMDSEFFNLIIADVMMPVMDGIELVKLLRGEGSSIPVLMITAMGEFDDMELGFASGVDDYMVKPININEMVLRVGALLRRSQMINERKLQIGSTTMEYDSMTVSSGGESFSLPQKEFQLLYKMASFPGRIFTKQQLMDDIWGYDNESDPHTVEVHIARLRDRFKDERDFKIVTIRGIGYKVEKIEE